MNYFFFKNENPLENCGRQNSPEAKRVSGNLASVSALFPRGPGRLFRRPSSSPICARVILAERARRRAKASPTAPAPSPPRKTTGRAAKTERDGGWGLDETTCGKTRASERLAGAESELDSL
jgi:hypothetical protein